MNFLTAQWNHLLFANYRIEPEVLRPFIPEGTRGDEFEGHTFVSLVAFMFKRTRILGVPVPYHINFEEVNLRFYVTPYADASKRGVTFIKEIVPRSVIPLIANTLFNENYIALPMAHTNTPRFHEYSFVGKEKYFISGRVDDELRYPSKGSVGEFITEHYWGYSKGRKGTLEYHVKHPQWTCCPLQDFQIHLDYASVYGNEFGFLTEQKPFNVMYAKGSEVSVSFPRRI